MKSLLHFIVHLTASLTRIPLTDRLHRATAGLSPESRGGKPGLVKAASSRRTPNFRRQTETTVGLSPESFNVGGALRAAMSLYERLEWTVAARSAPPTLKRHMFFNGLLWDANDTFRTPSSLT